MNELNIPDAIAAGTIESMRAMLYRCPVNWRAYIAALRACADAADPTAPVEPERVQATRIRLIRESAVPGHTIDAATAADIAELADRLIDTMQAQEAKKQAAFAEARRLIDLHGDTDHRAMLAIIHAVNLQDPAFMDRALAESGIPMPKATHCNEAGEPLFSLDAIAEALHADPDDLVEIAAEMESVGLDVRQVAAGRLQ